MRPSPVSERKLRPPKNPGSCEDDNVDLAASVAAAAAATATAATGRRRERFCGGAVGGAVCGTEDGQLDRIPLAGAARAGDFLRLVEDDLLEVGLAVVADVLVDGHSWTSTISSRQLYIRF